MNFNIKPYNNSTTSQFYEEEDDQSYFENNNSPRSINFLAEIPELISEEETSRFNHNGENHENNHYSRLNRGRLHSKMRTMISKFLDVITSNFERKLHNIEALIHKNVYDLKKAQFEVEKIDKKLQLESRRVKELEIFNCDKRFFSRMFKEKDQGKWKGYSSKKERRREREREISPIIKYNKENGVKDLSGKKKNKRRNSRSRISNYGSQYSSYSKSKTPLKSRKMSKQENNIMRRSSKQFKKHQSMASLGQGTEGYLKYSSNVDYPQRGLTRYDHIEPYNTLNLNQKYPEIGGEEIIMCISKPKIKSQILREDEILRKYGTGKTKNYDNESEFYQIKRQNKRKQAEEKNFNHFNRKVPKLNLYVNNENLSYGSITPLNSGSRSISKKKNWASRHYNSIVRLEQDLGEGFVERLDNSFGRLLKNAAFNISHGCLARYDSKSRSRSMKKKIKKKRKRSITPPTQLTFSQVMRYKENLEKKKMIEYQAEKKKNEKLLDFVIEKKIRHKDKEFLYDKSPKNKVENCNVKNRRMSQEDVILFSRGKYLPSPPRSPSISPSSKIIHETMPLEVSRNTNIRPPSSSIQSFNRKVDSILKEIIGDSLDIDSILHGVYTRNVLKNTRDVVKSNSIEDYSGLKDKIDINIKVFQSEGIQRNDIKDNSEGNYDKNIAKELIESENKATGGSSNFIFQSSKNHVYLFSKGEDNDKKTNSESSLFNDKDIHSIDSKKTRRKVINNSAESSKLNRSLEKKRKLQSNTIINRSQSHAELNLRSNHESRKSSNQRTNNTLDPYSSTAYSSDKFSEPINQFLTLQDGKKVLIGGETIEEEEECSPEKIKVRKERKKYIRNKLLNDHDFYEEPVLSNKKRKPFQRKRSSTFMNPTVSSIMRRSLSREKLLEIEKNALKNYRIEKWNISKPKERGKKIEYIRDRKKKSRSKTVKKHSSSHYINNVNKIPIVKNSRIIKNKFRDSRKNSRTSNNSNLTSKKKREIIRSNKKKRMISSNKKSKKISNNTIQVNQFQGDILEIEDNDRYEEYLQSPLTIDFGDLKGNPRASKHPNKVIFENPSTSKEIDMTPLEPNILNYYHSGSDFSQNNENGKNPVVSCQEYLHFFSELPKYDIKIAKEKYEREMFDSEKNYQPEIKIIEPRIPYIIKEEIEKTNPNFESKRQSFLGTPNKSRPSLRNSMVSFSEFDDSISFDPNDEIDSKGDTSNKKNSTSISRKRYSIPTKNASEVEYTMGSSSGFDPNMAKSINLLEISEKIKNNNSNKEIQDEDSDKNSIDEIHEEEKEPRRKSLIFDSSDVLSKKTDGYDSERKVYGEVEEKYGEKKEIFFSPRKRSENLGQFKKKEMNDNDNGFVIMNMR